MMNADESGMKRLLDAALDPTVDQADVVGRVVALTESPSGRISRRRRRPWTGSRGPAIGLAAAAVMTATAMAVSWLVSAGGDGVIETGSGKPTCPTAFLRFPWSGQHADGAMEPLDADSLLLCEYLTLGSPSPPDDQIWVTDPSVVADLRARMNSLPSLSGATHCPMDTGQTVYAIFVKGDRRVGIEVDLSGCQVVRSKAKAGWSAPDFGIQQQIRELLVRA